MREKSIIDEKSALSKARDEGIQQGIQQNKIDTIINLYNLGLSIEQIFKGVNISIYETKDILHNKNT